ncbi:TetR/AcrR family transcriptional regulator [Bailinhaonella thermotolerans]|uniref:TetR/AcrR family transcriptional regulator n=1 Tax=Bailinhaonella thermotolerans TaxID=1070861 RepID=UPI00192A2897|nr:TetR/AcrR family transcriptional regulator [Bailinhaonella thermotolerans]
MVYRRFGDRAGLAHALLDEREREFQQAYLFGPPPLGPGAPARERSRAFLGAPADRTEAQIELLLFAESAAPFARYASGAYGLYRSHVAALVAERDPGADAVPADALLAPLDARLYACRRREGMEASRVRGGLYSFVGLAFGGGGEGV